MDNRTRSLCRQLAARVLDRVQEALRAEIIKQPDLYTQNLSEILHELQIVDPIVRELIAEIARSDKARGNSQQISVTGNNNQVTTVQGDLKITGSIIHASGGENVTTQPGAVSDSIQNQKSALETAKRALAILEQQAAGYTSLTIPVHLRIELDDKSKEIAAMEDALRSAITPPDYSKPK